MAHDKRKIILSTTRHRTPTESGGFLTLMEEHDLAIRYRSFGDESALDRLVAAHLRLVHRVAQNYRKSGHRHDDLFGVGSLGLLHGLRKFDPGRKTRISTYVTYWIRMYISRFVREMHGPACVFNRSVVQKIFDKAKWAKRQLENSGQEVTEETLAKTMRVPLKTVKMALPFLYSDISLDRSPRLQNRASEGSTTPEDDLAEAEEKGRRLQLIRVAMASFSKREQVVIQERFLREDPLLLEEVAAKIGFSRERTRQLQLKALEKLKKIMAANELD